MLQKHSEACHHDMSRITQPTHQIATKAVTTIAKEVSQSTRGQPFLNSCSRLHSVKAWA